MARARPLSAEQHGKSILNNGKGNQLVPVMRQPQLPRFKVEGKEIVSLASNNYLGLSYHPRVIQAVTDAVREYGAGMASARGNLGTTELHRELDLRLAHFAGTEAAVTFQSGFTANLGTIPVLSGAKSAIFSDWFNHRSILDGCYLSRAKLIVYPHNDAGALEKELKQESRSNKLIVTDGVFGMDGELAPLKELYDLSQKYNATLLVDDAHGTGVMGDHGRGTINHFGLQDKVEVGIGSLSKAMGSIGGYVATTQKLRDLLVSNAEPQIFSTALPAHNIGASIAALELLERDEHLLSALWSNTKFFKEELKDIGFDTGNSVTPITPLVMKREEDAIRFCRALLEEGVLVQPIISPNVPKDKSRVRTIVTASHTRHDLGLALDAMRRVGKSQGLI